MFRFSAPRRSILTSARRSTSCSTGQPTISISTTRPEKVTRELESLDLQALAARIPDKQVGSDAFLRCVKPAEVGVKDLCKANAGRWIQYARNLARTLHRHGILMPIVCREDLSVINGIGRLEMLAEKARHSRRLCSSPMRKRSSPGP